MQPTKKVVIIAGEESGDAHAAVLAKQLHAKYPGIHITGIGGKHMQEAGVELVSDLAKYGVTGFSEVIRHLYVIRKAFIAIKNHLSLLKPDLLILVDYPGFNLRLAKFAKEQLNLKIVYYISPQIWAWKENRIHLIKKCISKMAVILPFEKPIYEKANVPVSFVGHPLIDKIPVISDPKEYRTALDLPLEAKLIAFLPGSRKNEIDRHMPIIRETMLSLSQQNPDYHFVIPVAGTIGIEQINSYFTNDQLPLTLVDGKAIECMAASDFVVVASGTASLECALLEKPMCIIYKSSLLTYLLVMKLIKVKYIGLCNLLTNQLIAPEFLQYDCNAIELTQYISNFHGNPKQFHTMKQKLSKLHESLSPQQSDCSLLELVESELN